MLLKKNESMDFIEADDGNVIIFDSESGNTHFIDEIGLDILHILEEETDLETLVSKLSEQYDAPVEEIRADVLEFVEDLIAKKVVLSYEN